MKKKFLLFAIVLLFSALGAAPAIRRYYLPVVFSPARPSWQQMPREEQLIYQCPAAPCPDSFTITNPDPAFGASMIRIGGVEMRWPECRGGFCVTGVAEGNSSGMVKTIRWWAVYHTVEPESVEIYGLYFPEPAPGQ